MRNLWALIFVACLAVSGDEIALAQNTVPQSATAGTVSEMGRMPDDQFNGVGANGVGFECSVELGTSLRPGYVALDFIFTLPIAATSERSILARVRPRPSGMLPRRNEIEIELPLVIEQGTTRVVVSRFVPKWTFGNSYAIELFEGGRLLDGCSLELGENQSGRRIVEQVLEQEIASSWLFVEPVSVGDSKRQAVIQQIRTWLEADSVDSAQAIRYAGNRRLQMSQVASQNVGVILSLAESELPDDWRAYQLYGSVAMEVSTYETLRANRSFQFSALRRWVLLGGTLVILGVEPNVQLSTLLGNVLSDDDQDTAANLIADRSVSEGERPRVMEPFANEFELGDKQDSASELASVSGMLMDIGIQRQVLGGGEVISLARDFPYQQRHWVVAKDLLTKSTSPALRRGVDPLFGDSRFRRWLIPGVAQPPVYTFMGLLTMFVILVGPVAYRFTTRRGRGYLMFAIAPVLAVFTTLSMFAYGIVADGFGTVARMRQITWVDGVTGDAVTRNRGTYFAGIRPAEGLRFDAEAEVMWYPDPLEMPVSEVIQMESPALGTVTIDAADQRFSPSFLPSRQQRQFIVHQAISNVGALTAKRIETVASGENAVPRVSLEVNNGLAMELNQVVICDSKGDFWSVDSIGAGSVVMVESQVISKDRSKLLGDLYNVQRMMEENSGASRSRQRPEAFDLISTLNQFFESGGREVSDGALENWLQESLQLGGSLEPGMYVGLAPIDPRFVATEDTELVDSVHFVIGTMP